MNDLQTNRNHNLSSWVDHKKTTFIHVLRPDLGAPVSNGEEVLGVAWVSLQCSDWSIVSLIPAISSWDVIKWYQTDLLRIYSAWHFAFLLQPRTTPWSVPIMNFAGIVASYSAQLTDRAALRSPASDSAMIYSVRSYRTLILGILVININNELILSFGKVSGVPPPAGSLQLFMCFWLLEPTVPDNTISSSSHQLCPSLACCPDCLVDWLRVTCLK